MRSDAQKPETCLTLDAVADLERSIRQSGARVRRVSIPGRPGVLADLPQTLHPDLLKAFRNAGIHSFYPHQLDAWNASLAGLHCCVTTGTASGKSLCYSAPVLHHCLSTPSSTALLLFPTKALAQDQLHMFARLTKGLDNRPRLGVYDGDTPSSARQAIRKNTQVIMSNPDMLHSSILPAHPQWAHFFENLRTVVIDEAHVYRGVFGSHVCNVLRRLLRLTKHYGGSPRFVLCSATLANPEDFSLDSFRFLFMLSRTRGLRVLRGITFSLTHK